MNAITKQPMTVNTTPTQRRHEAAEKRGAIGADERHGGADDRAADDTGDRADRGQRQQIAGHQFGRWRVLLLDDWPLGASG